MPTDTKGALDAQKLVNFLLIYNGRDKLSKLFQYGSRILYYHYLKHNPKSPMGLVLKAFYAAASDSRKFFRLGRWLYEYQTIYNTMSNPKMSSPVKALTVVAKSSWFWYWWWDNAVYLRSLKLLPMTDAQNARAALESARGWTYGCVFELMQVGVRWSALESERAAGAVTPVQYSAQKKLLVEDVIKQGSDLLTAVHYFGLYKWRDDHLGFWGSLNSYVSVTQYWRKA